MDGSIGTLLRAISEGGRRKATDMGKLAEALEDAEQVAAEVPDAAAAQHVVRTLCTAVHKDITTMLDKLQADGNTSSTSAQITYPPCLRALNRAVAVICPRFPVVTSSVATLIKKLLEDDHAQAIMGASICDVVRLLVSKDTADYLEQRRAAALASLLLRRACAVNTPHDLAVRYAEVLLNLITNCFGTLDGSPAKFLFTVQEFLHVLSPWLVFREPPKFQPVRAVITLFEAANILIRQQSFAARPPIAEFSDTLASFCLHVWKEGAAAGKPLIDVCEQLLVTVLGVLQDPDPAAHHPLAHLLPRLCAATINDVKLRAATTTIHGHVEPYLLLCADLVALATIHMPDRVPALWTSAHITTLPWLRLAVVALRRYPHLQPRPAELPAVLQDFAAILRTAPTADPVTIWWVIAAVAAVHDAVSHSVTTQASAAPQLLDIARKCAQQQSTSSSLADQVDECMLEAKQRVKSRLSTAWDQVLQQLVSALAILVSAATTHDVIAVCSAAFETIAVMQHGTLASQPVRQATVTTMLAWPFWTPVGAPSRVADFASVLTWVQVAAVRYGVPNIAQPAVVPLASTIMQYITDQLVRLVDNCSASSLQLARLELYAREWAITCALLMDGRAKIPHVPAPTAATCVSLTRASVPQAARSRWTCLPAVDSAIPAMIDFDLVQVAHVGCDASHSLRDWLVRIPSAKLRLVVNATLPVWCLQPPVDQPPEIADRHVLTPMTAAGKRANLASVVQLLRTVWERVLPPSGTAAAGAAAPPAKRSRIGGTAATGGSGMAASEAIATNARLWTLCCMFAHLGNASVSPEHGLLEPEQLSAYLLQLLGSCCAFNNHPELMAPLLPLMCSTTAALCSAVRQLRPEDVPVDVAQALDGITAWCCRMAGATACLTGTPTTTWDRTQSRLATLGIDAAKPLRHDALPADEATPISQLANVPDSRFLRCLDRTTKLELVCVSMLDCAAMATAVIPRTAESAVTLAELLAALQVPISSGSQAIAVLHACQIGVWLAATAPQSSLWDSKPGGAQDMWLHALTTFTACLDSDEHLQRPGIVAAVFQSFRTAMMLSSTMSDQWNAVSSEFALKLLMMCPTFSDTAMDVQYCLAMTCLLSSVPEAYLSDRLITLMQSVLGAVCLQSANPAVRRCVPLGWALMVEALEDACDAAEWIATDAALDACRTTCNTLELVVRSCGCIARQAVAKLLALATLPFCQPLVIGSLRRALADFPTHHGLVNPHLPAVAFEWVRAGGDMPTFLDLGAPDHELWQLIATLLHAVASSADISELLRQKHWRAPAKSLLDANAGSVLGFLLPLLITHPTDGPALLAAIANAAFPAAPDSVAAFIQRGRSQCNHLIGALVACILHPPCELYDGCRPKHVVPLWMQDWVELAQGRSVALPELDLSLTAASIQTVVSLSHIACSARASDTALRACWAIECVIPLMFGDRGAQTVGLRALHDIVCESPNPLVVAQALSGLARIIDTIFDEVEQKDPGDADGILAQWWRHTVAVAMAAARRFHSHVSVHRHALQLVQLMLLGRLPEWPSNVPSLQAVVRECMQDAATVVPAHLFDALPDVHPEWQEQFVDAATQLNARQPEWPVLSLSVAANQKQLIAVCACCLLARDGNVVSSLAHDALVTLRLWELLRVIQQVSGLIPDSHFASPLLSVLSRSLLQYATASAPYSQLAALIVGHTISWPRFEALAMIPDAALHLCVQMASTSVSQWVIESEPLTSADQLLQCHHVPGVAVVSAWAAAHHVASIAWSGNAAAFEHTAHVLGQPSVAVALNTVPATIQALLTTLRSDAAAPQVLLPFVTALALRDPVWLDPQTPLAEWVCLVVSSLCAEVSSSDVFRAASPLVAVDSTVATNLLPWVVVEVVCTVPDGAHSLADAINKLFESVNPDTNPSPHAHTLDILRLVLRTLQVVQQVAFELGSNKVHDDVQARAALSQWLASFNPVPVAQAALVAGLPHTALQALEMHKALAIAHSVLPIMSTASVLDTVYRHHSRAAGGVLADFASRDDVTLHERVWLAALEGCSDPDATFGLTRSWNAHLNLLANRHRGSWQQVLQAADSSMTMGSREEASVALGLAGEALTELGLSGLATRALSGSATSATDAAFESSWRMACWGATNQAATRSTCRPGFHEAMHWSLSAFRNQDSDAVHAAVDAGITALRQQLSSGALDECGALVDVSLSQLACLARVQFAMTGKVLPDLAVSAHAPFPQLHLLHDIDAGLLQGRIREFIQHCAAAIAVARNRNQLDIAHKWTTSSAPMITAVRVADPAVIGGVVGWRLEVARVLHAVGEVGAAEKLVRAVQESSMLKSSVHRTDYSRLLSMSLVLSGEWHDTAVTAAAGAESQDLLKAVDVAAASKNLRCQHDAHLALAKHAHARFTSLRDQMRSPEWVEKETMINKNQQKAISIQKELSALPAGATTLNGQAVVDVRRYLRDLQTRLSQDNQARSGAIQACKAHLLSAVEHYGRALCFGSSDAQQDAYTVFRLVALWFQHPAQDELSEALESVLPDISAHMFLPLCRQIVARLAAGGGCKPFEHLLAALVMRMAKRHPYHMLPLLLAASYVTGDVTRRQRVKEVLEALSAERDLARRVQDLARVWEAYIALADFAVPTDRSNPTPKRNHVLGSIVVEGRSRFTSIFDAVNKASIPVLTSARGIPDLDMLQDAPPVHVVRFDPEYTVIASGINLPKLVVCHGSDGRQYKQLVKGHDDMRQDAVMQQLFDVVNMLLQGDAETGRRQLRVRTYKVIPLTPRSGLCQWLNGTVTFGDYLVNTQTGAHLRYRPDDWTHKACRKIMEDVVPEPFAEKKKKFTEIMRNFQPVFQHFFMERFPSPPQWVTARLMYSRSVAANSIVGYIAGVGDRHTQNLLVDNATGEMIHIDFGVAFEQGLLLPTPERVPFRLSRDVVAGMGVRALDGSFRRSCEHVARVLRANCDMLLTVLEVFRHDPLHRWTLSPLKAQAVQAPTRDDEADSGAVPASLGFSTSISTDHGASGNEDAAHAMLRVRQKLQGADRNDGQNMSVETQVAWLIDEATNPDNLCSLFKGWAAWI